MKKLGVYIRVIVISLLISYLIVGYPGFYPFPQFTGKIVSYLLNVMNIDSTVDGTYILVAFPDIYRVLNLSAECSGMVLFSIFIFIIFSVPDISLSHRLWALPMLPILFTLNLIRIIIGILLGVSFSPSFLIFFHNIIGQVLMFLGAIIVYLFWLYLLGNFPREAKHYKADLDFG